MGHGGNRSTSDLADLQRQLGRLSGKACWSAIAGEGTGSDVKLDFGERVPRRSPVRNPRLEADQRDAEGEIDLFIQCGWRIEQRGAVLAGSGDENSENAPMLAGLSLLIGRDVVDVELAAPIPDMAIRFTGELRVSLFCDRSVDPTGQASLWNDVYSFRFDDTIFAMASDGTVTKEQRTNRQSVGDEGQPK